MRKLARILLLVGGIAGIGSFGSQNRDSERYWRWNEDDKKYEQQGNGDYRSLGLWFSPWYEAEACGVPWCGTVTTKLNLLSWSWVALVVGVGCLRFAFRVCPGELKAPDHAPNET